MCARSRIAARSQFVAAAIRVRRCSISSPGSGGSALGLQQMLIGDDARRLRTLAA